MRKPVVATRLSGVVKEFGEGNGVVYVDKPEHVITKAVELVNSGQLDQIGKRAWEFVQRHTWDSVTDEFEKILTEALREKRNGRI